MGEEQAHQADTIIKPRSIAVVGRDSLLRRQGPLQQQPATDQIAAQGEVGRRARGDIERGRDLLRQQVCRRCGKGVERRIQRFTFNLK